MKLITLLITGLFVSLTSFADIRDGEYSCTSSNGKIEVLYKIKSADVNGVSMPFMDITKTYRSENGTEKTYNVKGAAALFTDDQGQQTLVLGNFEVALRTGRPSCSQ